MKPASVKVEMTGVPPLSWASMLRALAMIIPSSSFDKGVTLDLSLPDGTRHSTRFNSLEGLLNWRRHIDPTQYLSTGAALAVEWLTD